MHTKVYPCDLCNKSFSRNGDLKRHKSIHSGEKNHACDVCGMRFAQHSGLKTHRNTHTGEKPHKCEYCGKAFGDPSSCARHEKEKHLGKPFQCHWCPSSIVRRSSFASHIRQKHPEIAHIVTKEYLDGLEGPRMSKPRNRRGRTRRSVILPDPRIVSKNIDDRLYGQFRCAPTSNNQQGRAPAFSSAADFDLSNMEVVDSKVNWDRGARRDTVAHPFAYGDEQFGSSYMNHTSMAPQRALQYTQSAAVYQRPQQMVDRHNLRYGLPVYSGPTEYPMMPDRGFEVRSVSSSPGPLTPADVKLSPVYVDPSKVNSYDYSFFGEEFVVPPLYSFVSEQQGLPLTTFPHCQHTPDPALLSLAAQPTTPGPRTPATGCHDDACVPAPPPAPFSPGVSSSTQDDALSFRPARDVEAFNSLLPPPIEFVEGSSSGALAVPEGKYQPINASPKLAREKTDPAPLPPASPVTPSTKKAAASQSPAVDLSWPESCDRACGLYNTGNTCFLNSALQCLLHTPPLLRQVFSHIKDKCRAGDKFCMICAFRQVTVQAYKSSSPFSPSPVSSRLQTIAKHMRRGRQEDSHEFLRYAIDAMQKSCLAGVPPKVEAKLGELTWVHKIFGGRLRSRVSCHNCGHNSDTFDRILDLSLDIMRADSLKDALRSFISPDFLKGADKYKCEKCKKHVNAEKRFTIHEAPSVLTVHLKRFSPLGRKIAHHVIYDDHLNLQPYMSKGQYGFTYSLYGVICHAGGGPNSGHYFAFVKSRSGRWYEMNDEMVSPISGPPVNKKTAYILFYIRDKGQGLQAVIKGNEVNGVHKEKEKEGGGLLAGMKKRRERDEDVANTAEEEDLGEKVGSPPVKFIGPLLPSPMERSSGSPTKKVKTIHNFTGAEDVKEEKKTDPQAEKVKRKIEAAKASNVAKARSALALLETYDSSDEGSDRDENVVMNGKSKRVTKARVLVESDDDGEAGSDKGEDQGPKPPSSPVSQFSGKQASSPISANNFYGPTQPSGKKGSTPHVNGRASLGLSKSRSSDDEDEPSPDKGSQRYQDHNRQKHRASIGSPGKKRGRGVINPYIQTGSSNNGGRMNTYGKRNQWRRPKARGI